MFELGNDGPSLILAAVDGSETSLRAAAYAAGLARRQHAGLAFVFVHSLGSFAQAVPGAIAAMESANRTTGEQLKETMDQNIGRLGITAEFIQRQGNPFQEICAIADQMRADAVVVGASTQAGHRIVGSLALALVRAARWPVTVVP
jgi:nucleotide-binding universal stress UspA family protein